MKRSTLKRSGFAKKTYAQALASRKPKQRRPIHGVRIDPADKYFSLYIRYRANWICERCQKQFEVGSQGLHCSHFWGRARESTRFDPVNCVAHCHGCHSFLTANPELHREWKLKQIGQAEYDKLTIRAFTTQKKDRALTAMVYRELYEEEKLRFEQFVS
jgi:hypothetical protein